MNLGLHHIQERRHANRQLEKFPSRSPARRAFDYLMIAVAIFGPLALAPQIYEIYTTHDVSSLVLSTWALLALFNLLWMIYGYIHKESPIMIANFVAGVFNSAGVLAIILYSV